MNGQVNGAVSGAVSRMSNKLAVSFISLGLLGLLACKLPNQQAGIESLGGTFDTSCKKAWDPAFETANNKLWHQTSATLMMSMRSNAHHYWRWIGQYSYLWFSPQDLRSGQITGDPHLNNFAPVWLNDALRFVLVDIDDAGIGPFLLDILKYITVIRSADPSLTTDSLFTAYLSGLQGNSQPVPRELKDKMAISLAERDAMWAAEIKKLTKKKGRLDFKKADLLPISELPEAVQQTFLKNRSQFLRAMQVKAVLDEGYKVKATGGSRGLYRFWFLIQAGEKREVYEFKQLGMSALSHYQAQANHQKRVADITATYWGDFNAFYYKPVLIDMDYYWLRPKRPRTFKVTNNALKSKKAQTKFKALAHYVANYLGLRHAGQNDSIYRQLVLKDTAGFTQKIDQAAGCYLQAIKPLYEEHVKKNNGGS